MNIADDELVARLLAAEHRIANEEAELLTEAADRIAELSAQSNIYENTMIAGQTAIAALTAELAETKAVRERIASWQAHGLAESKRAEKAEAERDAATELIAEVVEAYGSRFGVSGNYVGPIDDPVNAARAFLAARAAKEGP